MELKRLTARDREAVRTLFASVFTAGPWNDDWSDPDQLDAYISDLTGQGNSLTLGYLDRDRLVGLAMGHIRHWYTGTEYFIDEFCVDRSLQRKGIGSAFLAEIENYLARNGIRHILLLTDSDVPACEFYSRRGFRKLEKNVALHKRIWHDE